MTTVHEAWSAVMGDVQVVSKDSRNQDQGFNFRGIDAVMSAVGPALRRHGVFVFPTATDFALRQYQTRKGASMTNYVVTVRFTVVGPEGDTLTGVTLGEAADSGDKAVSKAMSVAFRTFLLQSLCIPTDEPDPDLESHEAVDPSAGFVERMHSAMTAWQEDDSRRDVMREQAKIQGWPAKLGGYSLEQIEAAALLAERLNEDGDPFLENAGNTTFPGGVVDVPTQPSTAAGLVDEQGSGGTSVVEPSPGPVNEGMGSDANL